MHQPIPGVANCDVPSSTWLSAAAIKQPTTMLRTVKGTTVGPSCLMCLRKSLAFLVAAARCASSLASEPSPQYRLPRYPQGGFPSQSSDQTRSLTLQCRPQAFSNIKPFVDLGFLAGPRDIEGIAARFQPARDDRVPASPY